MSWNNIPPFTAGQVLTSSAMNQILENQNIGHQVCTSTSRPASPDVGTMIFETDTNAILVWDGSSWQFDVGVLDSLTVTNNASIGGNLTASSGTTTLGTTSTGGLSSSSLNVSGTSTLGTTNAGATTTTSLTAAGNITSTGYITGNGQPFWYGTNPVGGGAYTVPRFTYAFSSRGSAYNTGNGRWTAPVAGVYYIHVAVIVRTAASGSYYSYFAIYRNGGQMAYVHQNRHTPEWVNTAVAACVYLNAGDYLEPYFWSVGGPYYYTGGQHAFYLCFRLA